jgi:hypothetical protein
MSAFRDSKAPFSKLHLWGGSGIDGSGEVYNLIEREDVIDVLPPSLFTFQVRLPGRSALGLNRCLYVMGALRLDLGHRRGLSLQVSHREGLRYRALEHRLRVPRLRRTWLQ